MSNQKQILSARGLRRLILQEVHRVIREQGNIVTTVATAAGEQEATDTQEELTKAIGEKLGLGANAPINAILQQFSDQTPADTERIAGTLDQMVTNIPGVGDMSPSDLVQFIRTAKRLADTDPADLAGELGLAQESVNHRMLEQDNEVLPPVYTGPGLDDTSKVGGISQALIDDYNSWVHKNGHITPAASSVMASYFVEHGMEEDHDAHQVMADFFSLEHEDVMRDINRQQSERSATMGEGTEIGNMPDSWRQILGSCLGENK